MGRTGSGAQLAQLAKRVLLSGFLLFALLVSPHGLALDEGENYCLYSDASFQGEELCGSEGSAWLSFYWFKRTSSLKVRDGYEIVAFPRIGYWGGFQIFSGEHETLGDWNNRIASFYVRESQAAQQKACFYSRKNYRGRRFCTDEEQYWFPWFWDDRISSVSVPAGLKVTLYSRWFFRGNSLELTASTPDLGDFNNVTSSLDIEENSQGTDSDGDGVDDSLDLCPDTPLGEMVNEQGCSPSQLDSDNDGVTDDLDLCPGTLGGNQVDENGCSSDQLDTDNDGVTNDLDQCPATPAGEAVDAVGCSASQLDEDGDGVSDAD
ncbi:MAG: peptidase inhibitor family I36 protein, partial [Pseudomonadota bacterium]